MLTNDIHMQTLMIYHERQLTEQVSTILDRPNPTVSEQPGTLPGENPHKAEGGKGRGGGGAAEGGGRVDGQGGEKTGGALDEAGSQWATRRQGGQGDQEALLELDHYLGLPTQTAKHEGFHNELKNNTNI